MRVVRQIVLGGIAPLAVVYFIFSLDLSSSVKNLILGLICLVVVMGFLGVARLRARRPLAPATLAMAVPTILWMAVLALNVLFDWGIPTLALWATYVSLFAFGHVLSAWLEPVEPISE